MRIVATDLGPPEESGNSSVMRNFGKADREQIWEKATPPTTFGASTGSLSHTTFRIGLAESAAYHQLKTFSVVDVSGGPC